MAWTAQDYLDRMAQTRKSHLKNIDMTGKMIVGIYQRAAKDLAAKAASAKSGGLTERWALDYQRALERRMAQMRAELGTTIKNGMAASARLPGAAIEGWLDDALRMIGVDGTFTGTLSHAPDAALRALLDGRMYRDGKSLSRRIWDKTAYLQGNIEEIVAQGIAQHRSALELARDLEDYVNPKAKMPVSWLKLYSDIPFDRQIDYNAQRLARTAINQSYWAAQIETGKANPFCRAIHWQLSPSHYERQVARFGEDVCDTYAAHEEGLGHGNWRIDRVPMPHAQCLCATWQVVPELDEVAERLSRWVDGGRDDELERAFGEWRNGLPAQTVGVTIKPDQRPAKSKREIALEEISQMTWARSLQTVDRDAILAVLGRLDDDELDLWHRNAHRIKGGFYANGTAHYNPQTQSLHMNLAGVNDKAKRIGEKRNTIVFFHETGHMLDYQAFGSMSLRKQMPELDAMLEKDYTAYANELFGKVGVKTVRTLAHLSERQKEVLIADLIDDPHLKSSVSDIVGGITHHRVQGWWGHQKNYWDTFTPATEAIAHMFEAKHLKGERLEVIKRYFPESYRYFEESIKRFDGGGDKHG